tara:strand:+ start:3252 stop:3605 length:354 start_codon:yes stop_codon:yes gene_type:complete
MKETDKYGSKLYQPNKPYYKMSIQELSDHCKVCQSLDKMSYEKIKRIEQFDDTKLQYRIKRFLNRNNRFTRKNRFKNTRKNKGKINNIKRNNTKRKNIKSHKKYNIKNKRQTKKQNI